MPGLPLGSELNLGLQITALILLLVGLRYAIRTHGAISKVSESEPAIEKVHMNIMTVAVIVSGIGVVVWMIPSLVLGWSYGSGGLGYGTGGYISYFQYNGVFLPHWYLLAAHVPIGIIAAILGVYLVLRMRVKSFPPSLAVKNFKAVMIFTWSMWFLNILIGIGVFYFFAFAATG